MANDKRICKVCGNTYNYCPSCAKYAKLPSWMWKCDTEECNDIFESLSAYGMGLIEKDAVKEVLSKHNVTDYSKFNENIQNKLTIMFPIQKQNKQKKNKFVDRMDIELEKTEENTDTNVDEVLSEVLFNGISEE